jgi:RimJ/RimL family protein N-acetyltransferase
MQTKTIQLKAGQTATIRQARVEDATDVLNYANEVVAETDLLGAGKGELDWTEEKERAFLQDHHGADNKVLILAEVKGDIVGMAGFTGDERKRMRHSGECGLSVLRKYWGLGIGAALMESMIAWARSSGVVRKIALRVRVDNHRAVSLYGRLGFVQEGLVTRQFLVAGTFYDAYVMGLEIDP